MFMLKIQIRYQISIDYDVRDTIVDFVLVYNGK